MREFNSLKIERGDDPTIFTLMVNRFATELRRVRKAIDEDDKNPVVLNALPQEYAVER